ncbi:hypothetical protein PUN28_013911 [Cardiocondyla obscurior]|uniref:Uncharacterized protein n=1 Tax=Cardiocondyla obscurior TaxID=286306 RepID=A0AAW2F3P7_9HYME
MARALTQVEPTKNIYFPGTCQHKIDDISILPFLTDEELKELIPLLGDRKKFQIALASQKRNSSDKTLIQTIDNSLDTNAEKKPKYVFVDYDVASTSSSNYFDETENTNSDSDNTVINNDIITGVLKVSDINNFNLKNLLNNHIIGKAILLKYAKTKSLDNKDRNNLCDIIICHFLNEGKRLNNTTISVLADKIIEIFEQERKSTYFVSPIGKRKSRYNKPEIARGKLVDKHRNKLTIIRKNLIATKIDTNESKQGKFLLY